MEIYYLYVEGITHVLDLLLGNDPAEMSLHTPEAQLLGNPLSWVTITLNIVFPARIQLHSSRLGLAPAITGRGTSKVWTAAHTRKKCECVCVKIIVVAFLQS